MKAGARRRAALGLLLVAVALGADADPDDGEARVRVRSARPSELGCWLDVESTSEPAERFELLGGPQLCDPARRGGSLEGRSFDVRWRRDPWPRCLDCEERILVRRIVDLAPASRAGRGGCGG